MNERVKLIRKQLGMTQEQLAQRLGIGKAALSMIETGKAGLSARNRNILVQELNVNPEWLEAGKGNMFNAEPDLTAYMHRTDNSLPLQSVPLYSIEGTAGLVPLFADQAQTKPVIFIHIPTLPKCDGAIYIVGDSMYPLLKSGDIVLYKQLRDIDDGNTGSDSGLARNVAPRCFRVRRATRFFFAAARTESPTRGERERERSKVIRRNTPKRRSGAKRMCGEARQKIGLSPAFSRPKARKTQSNGTTQIKSDFGQPISVFFNIFAKMELVCQFKRR